MRVAGAAGTLALTLALLVVAPRAQTPAGASPPAPDEHRLAFEAWLDRQVDAALTDRRREIAGITTAAAVQARGARVREILTRRLAPLPPTDAPLDAAITRTQRRDGYRIEHVRFDSLPGYRVTALAYVPDGPGPFPAVLGTAGHSEVGKAHPLYQHAWISLARRGFLVLAYDPPGQGERIEYLDPPPARRASASVCLSTS